MHSISSRNLEMATTAAVPTITTIIALKILQILQILLETTQILHGPRVAGFMASRPRNIGMRRVDGLLEIRGVRRMVGLGRRRLIELGGLMVKWGSYIERDGWCMSNESL